MQPDTTEERLTAIEARIEELERIVHLLLRQKPTKDDTWETEATKARLAEKRARKLEKNARRKQRKKEEKENNERMSSAKAAPPNEKLNEELIGYSASLLGLVLAVVYLVSWVLESCKKITPEALNILGRITHMLGISSDSTIRMLAFMIQFIVSKFSKILS